MRLHRFDEEFVREFFFGGPPASLDGSGVDIKTLSDIGLGKTLHIQQVEHLLSLLGGIFDCQVELLLEEIDGFPIPLGGRFVVGEAFSLRGGIDLGELADGLMKLRGAEGISSMKINQMVTNDLASRAVEVKSVLVGFGSDVLHDLECHVAEDIVGRVISVDDGEAFFDFPRQSW